MLTHHHGGRPFDHIRTVDVRCGSESSVCLCGSLFARGRLTDEPLARTVAVWRKNRQLAFIALEHDLQTVTQKQRNLSRMCFLHHHCQTKQNWIWNCVDLEEIDVDTCRKKLQSFS